MAKLVTNGSFYVVAAAEKGARPEMVYWDECPSGFKFCSGVNGEEVYHIVYNSRKEAGYKDIRTPFLCVVSHTKNSTYPSDDVKNNGSNAKWKAFNTQALIATDLMLARKILAGEIDVESLTVKNVNATSSDGETTCTITGNTGKLTAKKAEFDGVTSKNMTATNMTVDGITATNANVEGVMTVKTLRRKMLPRLGSILDGSISVFSGAEYTLPYLELGECVEAKILSITATKVMDACFLWCGSYNVRVFVGGMILDAKYGYAALGTEAEVVGFRYDGIEGLDSSITYWRIIPIGTTDTSSITITELPWT